MVGLMTTHSCNAYCRDGCHAVIIHQFASAPAEPMAPERWRRLWARELRRDLGPVMDVQIAHEAAWPDEHPIRCPHRIAAYLVTYGGRS